MQIKARTKYIDLYQNYRLSHLIAIIGFVLALSTSGVLIYIWLGDWLICATFIACAITGFLIFSRPSREVEVSIDEEAITYSTYIFKFKEIVSWAMVDLGDTLEFVLMFENATQPFEYLYIEEFQPGIKDFIRLMQENVPYDPTIPERNYVHRLLRLLRLK